MYVSMWYDVECVHDGKRDRDRETKREAETEK